MSFDNFKEKLNDPSLTTSRIEKLFYQALGVGIFVVGVVPSLLFLITAPGIEKSLRFKDTDEIIPKK